MRPDMPQVLVERPRRDPMKLLNRQPVRFDEDPEPMTISARRDARMRGGSKRLSENFAPLRRFLRSQVGRPWRKVWSEVCAQIAPTNAVQKHVLDHLAQFVATQTWIEDGRVYYQERRGGPQLLDPEWPMFYVEPKSGLLRENKRRTWRRERQAAAARCQVELERRRRVLSAVKELHLLGDGSWYEVTIAPWPDGVDPRQAARRPRRRHEPPPVADVLIRSGLTTLGPQELYGSPSVYATAMRQLSKKELRRHGLR